MALGKLHQSHRLRALILLLVSRLRMYRMLLWMGLVIGCRLL